MALKLTRQYNGQAANTIYAMGWTPGWTAADEALLRGSGGGSDVLEGASDFAQYARYMQGGRLAAGGLPTGNANLGVGVARGLRLASIGTSLVDNDVYVSVAGRLIGYSARGWKTWGADFGRRFIQPIWHDPTAYVGWEPSGTPGATRGYQGLNFGVAGQTVDQIIARIPFVQTYYTGAFDAITVDAGTNDMSVLSKEEIRAKRMQIVDAFLAMGVAVIVTPILARGVAPWPAGSDQRKKANWLNADTPNWVAARKNCYFWNWSQTFANGSDPYGQPRTGYSNDGTHFAVPGGEAVGGDLDGFLSGLGYPPRQIKLISPDDLYDAAQNPTGNLLTNGLMLGTGGSAGTGATGSVATGFTVARQTGTSTVACSKETRADGRGEYQVLTFTPSGGGSDDMIYLQASPDFAHNAAGGWLQGESEIIVNNGEGISGITLYVRDTSANGWIAHDMIAQPTADSSANVIWAARARSLSMQSAYLHVQNNSTTCRFRIEVRLRGASAVQPVIKIGTCAVRRVDDPRPSALQYSSIFG